MRDILINEKPISFASKSGRMLGGTLFEGDGDGPAVLISGATAVPHRYYAQFRPLACGARCGRCFNI